MAQVILNIPDGVAQRVINALCALNNSTPSASNAKQVVINHIMDITASYEAKQAIATTTQAAVNNVNSQIQIT